MTAHKAGTTGEQFKQLRSNRNISSGVFAFASCLLGLARISRTHDCTYRGHPEDISDIRDVVARASYLVFTGLSNGVITKHGTDMANENFSRNPFSIYEVSI